jgi:hypothetical protein
VEGLLDQLGIVVVRAAEIAEVALEMRCSSVQGPAVAVVVALDTPIETRLLGSSRT